MYTRGELADVVREIRSLAECVRVGHTKPEVLALVLAGNVLRLPKDELLRQAQVVVGYLSGGDLLKQTPDPDEEDEGEDGGLFGGVG